jgi:hypothetical protein
MLFYVVLSEDNIASGLPNEVKPRKGLLLPVILWLLPHTLNAHTFPGLFGKFYNISESLHLSKLSLYR